jgi:hypothetical protein
VDDLIDRLRKSKARSLGVDLKTGRASGRKWAAEEALYPELERIAKGIPRHYWNTRPYHVNVYIAIFGGDSLRIDPEQFWQQHSGTLTPTAEFIDSFVEGAHAVFAEVKDQL